MAERNFLSAEDWIGGAGQDGNDFDRAASVEAAGQMQDEVAFFQIYADAEDETDGVYLEGDAPKPARRINRKIRRVAKKQRREVRAIKAGKASSASEVVLNSRFVMSREVRMPLPDKRKVVLAKDTVTPVDAQAILSEDRTASVEARLGVFRRVAALRDAESVDALLNDTRE